MKSISETTPFANGAPDSRVTALLGQMTLAEKIGQMCQLNAGEGHIPDDLAASLRAGQVGALLNEVNVETVNELQRIAMEESRLGIPLLIGRDVIHGFKTVMPIPLGQAASWNPELLQQCARVAAEEAATAGVNWTFAPMIDIARDPRWGRIAESLGEDPFLAGALGAAMVRGFQGGDLAAPGNIAACAKHFAGYGTVESGRDYATTNVPENELRNVYLPPFKAAVDAGVLSLMTAFSDLDGVPATASEFLLREILKGEWGYTGMVVSDWDSVRQLCIHGLTANDREAALEAARAGVDMEMAGDAYLGHLEALVENGALSLELIDDSVTRILTTKVRLGLLDNPYTDPGKFAAPGSEAALDTAKKAALESAVLLKNEHGVLPLDTQEFESIAILGPLADTPHDQLGTWVFDGDQGLAVTPLTALRAILPDSVELAYHPAMATSRSSDPGPIAEAAALAADADATILFLGEEAILSGEAHSRADIRLPGAQAQLVRKVRATGKPVIAVIMAGRPLTLTNIIDDVDALLYAWHPGTMAGPALADLLFGLATPVGKLPATLPRMVGQVPIYYCQKNTGKPPSPDTIAHIDDIDPNAPQLSIGMTAFHLDAGYTPLFPFGFGLTYTTFTYDDIKLSSPEVAPGDSIRISADITNVGDRAGDETVQLYIRDLVGNVTRPVRELKGFKRVHLEPDQTKRVEFTLHTDALAFYGRNQKRMIEPGDFHAWIGGSSQATLQTEFRLVGNGQANQ